MPMSAYSVARNSFVPMLESLTVIMEKAEAFQATSARDLVDARLAPDMFTLAQQVQQACRYAIDGMARLSGQLPTEQVATETSLAGLKAQIDWTVAHLLKMPEAAFKGAEQRNCNIELQGGMMIEMDGARFLIGWSLPHFYFHIVTAYDILRHNGMEIGKQDYQSQVGGFIRRNVA